MVMTTNKTKQKHLFRRSPKWETITLTSTTTKIYKTTMVRTTTKIKTTKTNLYSGDPQNVKQ